MTLHNKVTDLRHLSSKVYTLCTIFNKVQGVG